MGERVFPRSEPLIGYPIPSGQPCSHICANSAEQTEQAVYIVMHLYTAAIITNLGHGFGGVEEIGRRKCLIIF